MEYLENVPYSVKFFASKNKLGKTSIHVRIGLNRKKAEFSAKIKCDGEDWDADLMRFNNNKSYNKFLNNKLMLIENKVLEAFKKIRNSGGRPSAALLKQVYLGNDSGVGAPKLLEYVKQYINESKKIKNKYASGTLAHYKTLLVYLKEYLNQEELAEMRMDEWKRKHFVQFENFLLTRYNPMIKGPVGRATSNKYLAKLKVVFNHALANEVITVDPKKGFTMHRVVGKREYLTRDEIEKIELHELGKNESLDRVRWIFLFSVFTGLRFSDAMSLKRTSIILESDNHYYIEIIQQKTSEPLYRPLLGKAIQIYERFKEEYPESEYVLPKISNQKTNVYLKTIADLCGIRKRLSHHIARHTFATTVLLDSGIDLKTTSYFMGHSSIKTTEIYGKITKNRATDVVKMLDRNL